MRIPGIQAVFAVRAAELPDDLEILSDIYHVMPDLQSDLVRLPMVKTGTATIADTSKKNCRMQQVSVSFTLSKRVIVDMKSCFVCELVDGGCFLIGTKDAIPEFRQEESITTEGGQTANKCTIELTSIKAWIPINAVKMSQAEEAEAILGGNSYNLRPLTETEIDDIIDSLEDNE